MPAPPTALQFCRILFEDLAPEGVRRRFLRLLLDVQQVRRGSIWVRRGDRFECVECATAGEADDITGLQIPAARPSLVRWVIEHGEMTVSEGASDPRHYREAERGLDTKSSLILCFPLVFAGGEVYGAVQVIDTSATGDRMNLDADYLHVLGEIVSVASIALGHSLVFSDKMRENTELRAALRELRAAPEIVAQDRAFLQVLKTVKRYARTHFPVLITGESGTGKEVVSREIHRLSPRAGKPFLVQNCSAIPEPLLESELFGYRRGAFTGANEDRVGLFEAADGGTLFLDEVGDMPVGLQARILRVLENAEIRPLGSTEVRHVDVRVVAATNRDLPRAVADGDFREDLLFRLNVLPLQLPPLRHRRADIQLLARWFLAREAEAMQVEPKTLAPGAVAALTGYSWPGNVRELANLMRYLLTVVPTAVITLEDLPEKIGAPAAAAASPADDVPAAAPAGLKEPLDTYTWAALERTYIEGLLERHRWSVTRAAAAAAVNRSTFHSRMRRLGIHR